MNLGVKSCKTNCSVRRVITDSTVTVRVVHILCIAKLNIYIIKSVI